MYLQSIYSLSLFCNVFGLDLLYNYTIFFNRLLWSISASSTSILSIKILSPIIISSRIFLQKVLQLILVPYFLLVLKLLKLQLALLLDLELFLFVLFKRYTKRRMCKLCLFYYSAINSYSVIYSYLSILPDGNADICSFSVNIVL